MKAEEVRIESEGRGNAEQQFQPSVLKRKGSIRPEFEINGAISGYPLGQAPLPSC